MTTLTMPSGVLLRRFSEHVESHLGLSMPASRWADLLRAMEALAGECALPDAHACMERWLAAPLQPAQVQGLAHYLAVGETYFFREPAAFEALEHHVLMPLIAQRRAAGRRFLRIWSAGCCTGEEVYSLAIVLQRLLPDADDWNVTLLGTDIHPGFLEQARRGIYAHWSFRGVPDWMQRLEFDAVAPGEHAVRPELRRWTRFDYLNLAAEPGPDRPEAMDLVLCRHVLMYFEPAQAARALKRLRGALAPQGWLLVGAAETGGGRFDGFDAQPCRGAVLYRNRTDPAPLQPVARLSERPDLPPRPAAAIDCGALGARARVLADQGRHEEALHRCRAALALDKRNAELHYLHALIEQERARPDEAEAALLRALYLDPDFVLAWFALARLAERQGRTHHAARHLQQALRALAHRPADAPLPAGDGLSAARLGAVIVARLGQE